MIKPQKTIWDLIKARNFEEIETIKHNCYVIGNHKAIEDIEQWILQYYDELEESKELTELNSRNVVAPTRGKLFLDLR
jgi:hypothetical protein